jgi:hypothetical protein
METDLREQLERARNRTRLLPSSIGASRDWASWQAADFRSPRSWPTTRSPPGASERWVAASRWRVPICGGGGFSVALSSDDRRRLDDAALARGTTSAELALTVLRMVVQHNLIKAVIDDGGNQ